MSYKLLLLKEVKKDQDKLLFGSYSNFIKCLVEIGLNKNYDLDNIYKRYMGLVYKNISKNDKEFGLNLESMLPLFSYLQHSQGGRGSFIEKLISLLNPDVTRNSKLSDLPLIFSDFNKLKIIKIYDSEDVDKDNLKLINQTKREFKTNFLWLGDNDENITFDLLKLQDGTLKLSDIKNRVDSGGTAARGESWKKILDTIKLINENKVVFQDNLKGTKYALLDYLLKNSIKTLNLSFDIIYNLDGSSATISGDRINGFLSESIKRYEAVVREIESHSNFKNIVKDKDNLFLSCDFEVNEKTIKIEIKGLYGADIIREFFSDGIKNWKDVENKIELYDDIWLTLKTVIEDRKILILKNNNILNFLNKIWNKLNKDKINELIKKNNFSYLEINNLLKYYQKGINDICKDKKHITNSFIIFCLYRRSLGELL